MKPSGPQWSQTFTYDGFGNLYKNSGTGLANGFSWDRTSSLVSGKNQLGTNYDANGNWLGQNQVPLQYDYDNRLEVSGSMAYGYGADNKRVYRRKVSGTVQNPIYTDYIYFYSGNQRLGTYRMERNAQNQPVLANVSQELYFGGRRLASEDRLGSTTTSRLLPYGEEITPTLDERNKFATYHRDEDGIDYADHRYYSPGSGRFLTVDPFNGSAKLANPSTWNRYAYVEGDPINSVDPSGLTTCGGNILAGTYSCYDSVTVSAGLVSPFYFPLRETGGITPPTPKNTLRLWTRSGKLPDSSRWHETGLKRQSRASTHFLTSRD